MKRFLYLTFVVLIIVTSSVPVLAIPIEAGMASAVSAFTCASVTEIPQPECETLVALFNNTNGPSWPKNNNWLVTEEPSGWYGITVASGHVTSLSLDENNLIGTIPTQIGNLTNLAHLDLAQNQLSGNIPPELGNLTQLTFLSLFYNGLTGNIPLALCNLTNLEDLFLFGNALSGSVPPQLSNLTHLTGLYLGNNNFSGGIPPELGTLANLTALTLYANQLSGSIPPELGNLTKLNGLNLAQNRLSGSIPADLGKLSNLNLLWLQNNRLSGDIPATFINLVNLADPGGYGGVDGLSLDYNILNVPQGYPDPGIALHAFLYQKDPDWHLRQIRYFLLPFLQR